MKIKILTMSLLLATTTFAMWFGLAMAHDLKGHIQFVDPNTMSFVLDGNTVYTTESTRYHDGLKGFVDLRPGQKVEVDYHNRDGRRYAKKIELEEH